MKKLKIFVHLVIIYFTILMLVNAAMAKDLKVSLGQIPIMAESPVKGVYVDLIKAMNEAYKDGKIIIEVNPFMRSLNNVINQKSDFMAPALRNPRLDESKLPYTFSDRVGTTKFVLYTNKNNIGINPKNLKNYKIESSAPMIDFFDFPIEPSHDYEQSLKKLELQRIDGVIIVPEVGNMLIQKLNLKNMIKSWDFVTYDNVFVLRRGPDSQKLKEIINSLIRKLKKDGTLKKILGPDAD